jgi:hypothetical protein
MGGDLHSADDDIAEDLANGFSEEMLNNLGTFVPFSYTLCCAHHAI